MRKIKTTHADQVVHLKRIEGQIRGVQKMIEQGDYCVDILTQLHAVIGAMKNVENNVFKKHLQGCVAGAIKGRSEKESREKIDEVIALLARFKKG
jgi:DNA-binding FrmR family transcriptional regulator